MILSARRTDSMNSPNKLAERTSGISVRRLRRDETAIIPNKTLTHIERYGVRDRVRRIGESIKRGTGFRCDSAENRFFFRTRARAVRASPRSLYNRTPKKLIIRLHNFCFGSCFLIKRSMATVGFRRTRFLTILRSAVIITTCLVDLFGTFSSSGFTGQQ